MRYSILKKRIKKIASVSVAATMLINNLAFAEIALPFRNFIITAFAVEPEGTEQPIKSMNQLAEFAQNYTHDNKNDTLAINFVDEESYDPDDFVSIANSEQDAFSGKITINLTTNDHALILDKPLFNYLSTDAEIEFITDANSAALPQYLEIRRYGTDGTPILANHVVQGSKGTTNTWKIMPACYSVGVGDQIEHYQGASSGIIGFLDSGTVNLDVRNDALSVADSIVNSFTGTGNVGALVNEMADDTTLNVMGMSGSNTSYSITAVGNNGHAGGLVGKMGKATLNVRANYVNSFLSSQQAITSEQGYAGGLVGYAENAKITIDDSVETGFASTPVKYAVVNDTVKGKMGAGGLFGCYSIGENWSGLDLTQYSFPSSNKLTVGVTEDTSNFVNNPDGFAGGLFGELLNENDDATAFSISDGSTDSAYASVYVALASDSKKADAFGGLIGKYSANKVGHSLTISGVDVANNGAPITTVNAAGCSTYPNHLGGLVGRVDGDAYVTVTDMNISASSVNHASTFFEFGGAVGYVEKGFINVEDLTITSSDSKKSFQGGGVIGSIDNGILVLSGTFDSINAAVAGDRYHHGHIVGYRDSSLILAKPGFIFKRSSPNTTTNSNIATAYDDIGAWGELLRFNNDSGSTRFSITDVFSDFASWSTNHYITLPAASISSDVVQIGSKEQYALAALNIQLDHNSHDSTNGVLRFSDTTNELWTMDMEMIANVDLSGTGLLGLTRDNYSCIYKTYVDESDGETKWVVSSGARSTEYSTPERLTYTGTFDGDNKTLTLAIGEKYGERDNVDVADENKSGRIYNHSFSGLFAQADGATVQNLTVGGTISVSAARDNLYIGSIVARLIGNFDAEGITVNTVFTDGGSNSNHNTGGMIGQVYYVSTDTSSHVINIGTDAACVFNAEINSSAGSTNYIGGVIGRINSTKAGFTLNAENVTIQNEVSQSNTAKSEQTIGGFIGYIDSATSKSSVNSRIINIGTSSNAFVISGLDVKGTVAQTYAASKDDENDIYSLSTGGLLGYAWYDTTVVFNDLDVDSSSVYAILGTNPRGITPDMAGLVYNATGYWKVDDVSMSNVKIGGESDAVDIRSLGLLVNKGWNSDSALYLELDDSKYTLTGITVSQLQSSKPVYDEIVAYSATYEEKKKDSNNNRINERGEAKVTSNGQGIVSIMTSTGALNITGSANTYQNRTDGSTDDSSVMGNPNTRYYYNLDSILRKTDANKSDAEKLLSWSVYQYAYKSIRDISFTETVGGETKTLQFTNPYPSGAISQSFTTTVENEGEDDETTIETFTGDGFDMTGLSYYPINVSDAVSIKGHVKLYNESIEALEALNGSDSYARTTLSQSTSAYTHARTQHYLMQNGVFLNITGSLTVDGELYLDGTINTESDVGSGALVCGKIGNTAANPATFSSEDGKIILNGIEVATRTPYASPYQH